MGSRCTRAPAGHDVRAPISTSRPADLLQAAGALDVVGCHDLTDLVDWLEVPGGIAVADAATDNDLAAIANRWVGVDGVLLAGTSAAIGAAGARLFDSGERNERPSVHGPVLVVCGSANPRALEQVDRAEERGAQVLRDGYELALDAVADGEPIVLAPPAPVEPDGGRCGSHRDDRHGAGGVRRSPPTTNSERSS